jgi:isoleucyl-tRNA synthetase
MESKLKVRQPLSRVEVTLVDGVHAQWLAAHDDIVREELNVKEIHYTSGSSPFVTYSVQPNFRKLGPRVGPLLPKLKSSLAAMSGAQIMDEMTRNGKMVIDIDGKTIELDGEDIQVRLAAKEGWAASQGNACVVALNTELTPELIRDGIAKDAIRLIQDLRKRKGCNYTDRIELVFLVSDQQVEEALVSNRDFIAGETLAQSIAVRLESLENITSSSSDWEPVELAESPAKLSLVVSPANSTSGQ